uniref:Uncharacterized protein n=1 Tax=Arundo donax TaxID=35708 RepID=A0A0A8ZZX7_ARUDO
MALCGGGRVAVLAVLLLSLTVTALIASPPCAAARVLLAGGETQEVGSGKKEGGPVAATAAESGFRGSPDFAGRRTAAGNVVRVLGSVPSPGVGH